MANESVTVSLEVIDKATKAIDDVIKRLDKLNDTAKEGASGFKAFGAVFAGSFASDVALKGISAITSAATKLFDVLVIDGVHAAQEAQDGLNKLSTAFALAGQDAVKASKDFSVFAEELQNTTKFSDDAIISAGALLESLTRLNEKGLKQATQAALDFASAQGIDLDTATRLVGKAANGNVEAFKRYGVEIRKGKDDAESFANTLAVLNSRFGGSAAAQVNTFSGSIARAANIFNNLQEAVGNAIVGNTAVINVINRVGDAFNSATDYVKDNKEEMRVLVTDGLTLAIEAMKVLLQVAKESTGVFNFLSGSTKAVATSLSGAAAIITSTFTSGLSAAGDVIDAVGQDLKGNFQEAVKGSTTALDSSINALDKLGNSAQNGIGVLTAEAGNAAGAVVKAGQSIREFSDEEVRAGEEGKKFIESLTKSQPLDEFKVKLEQISQAFQQNKITAEQSAAGIAQATDDATAAEVAALQKRNEALATLRGDANLAELDQNNARINELLSQEETRVQRLAEIRAAENGTTVEEEIAKGDLIIANEKRVSDKVIELKAKQAQAEKASRDKQIGYATTALDNLSTLTKTNNKELFEAGKAFAIASSIINTSQAVTKALADPGGLLGGFLATSYAIKGAVEIANISAQTLNSGTSFVQGTNVGNRDSVPALLTVGERVVSRDQNTDLTSFLENQGDTKEILLMIADAVSRDRPINVSVGGEQIFNAVNEQVRAGRAFAS